MPPNPCQCHQIQDLVLILWRTKQKLLDRQLYWVLQQSWRNKSSHRWTKEPSGFDLSFWGEKVAWCNRTRCFLPRSRSHQEIVFRCQPKDLISRLRLSRGEHWQMHIIHGSGHWKEGQQGSSSGHILPSSAVSQFKVFWDSLIRAVEAYPIDKISYGNIATGRACP